MFVIADVTTKRIWDFPLNTRSDDELLGWVKHWVSVILPRNHQLLLYHADGGAELIDQKLKSCLLQVFGTRVTWSATDTPERKFGTLVGEMALAMLADSGLPKSFWWDLYVYACDITRMMPSRTCCGWMSPAECVPGGLVPNLSRLRRWGCKAYDLIPKADRCKD